MIQIENILKVADIDTKKIHIATRNFLINFFIEYKDKVSDEHLININSAIEEVDTNENEFITPFGNEQQEIIKLQVAELNNLCQQNDCAYIRLVDL